ncbi:MAG: D-sedoheptulose 7-phosphate isomerase [Candidatus Margulisbacteria bacterium]|nr:D-sedoheptulose 7-phosphate isomerase [Candidatus Margulisiibacteriota bacterium]MBU1616213.1 D-sedoheptulose 7-phosphate isomerase [Candidatus Margulisiibacteriota bacterium]MBU1867313.1 D-sedoheptulose 7-phosphate isomerase [Candidatus Margulisiibacteriota bacterium]
MQKTIIDEIKESIEVKDQVIKKLVPQIETAAKTMIAALQAGNKILFFGNGGSAADAQHLAAELVSRYRKERSALPAIALTTDTSIITAIGNDYNFDVIFTRQIEALAQKGDITFGFSTSGNSNNVFLAMKKAKEIGCRTIALLGCGGGRIADAVDLSITIPSQATPRVQESHILIGHILCGLIENAMFGGN